MKGIILAAGRGSRMGNLTNEKPKCLLEVFGKPLIEHQIEALEKAGIKEIALVTGYKSELLNRYGTRHFHNEKWAETNMVYSLLCAKEWLNASDCIVSYADIYYESKIVRDLMGCRDDIGIAYDPNWLDLWSKRFENPLDDAETFRVDSSGYLLEIGQRAKTVEEIQGQYMGLIKIKKGVFEIEITKKEPLPFGIDMTTFLNSLIPHVSLKAIATKTKWMEYDSYSDIEKTILKA